MADHNYLRKVAQYLEAHRLPPGTFNAVGVYHDPWCGVHKGGRCNCDPDVELLSTHARVDQVRFN
jgi:hypothetical protein